MPGTVRASVYAAWAAMDSALLALGSVSLKKNTITVGHWPQSEEGLKGPGTFSRGETGVEKSLSLGRTT